MTRLAAVLAGDLTEADLLPVGSRIRDVNHPELTGTIKGWEYHESKGLSPIPYLVAWDDGSLLFVYATCEGVEPIFPLGDAS